MAAGTAKFQLVRADNYPAALSAEVVRLMSICVAGVVGNRECMFLSFSSLG